MEKEGITTDNFQWQGWSAEELIATYDKQQGRKRRHLNEILIHEDVDVKPFQEVRILRYFPIEPDLFDTQFFC